MLCSLETITDLKDENKIAKEYINSNHNTYNNISSNHSFLSSFNCQSYSWLIFNTYNEYFEEVSQLNLLVKQLVKAKAFRPKHFNFAYFNNHYLYTQSVDDISMETLCDIAVSVYDKVVLIYSYDDNNSYNNYCSLALKSEYEKITFSLIANYLFYESYYNNINNNNLDLERIIHLVTEHLVKRIVFFIDDYPFKLIHIKKVIHSGLIYPFGYDLCFRITFYIMLPNNSFHLTQIQPIDYVMFIIFILETIQIHLIDEYSFNKEINLLIDFAKGNLCTEFICFILSYFNKYYPLIIRYIHLVNYDIHSITNNSSFMTDLDLIDPFNSLIFHNDNYKKNLIQYFNPNCLLIQYGGYSDPISMLNNFTHSVSIEDSISNIVNMILRETV